MISLKQSKRTEADIEATAMAIAWGEYDAGGLPRPVGYWEFYDTQREKFLRSALAFLRAVDEAIEGAKRGESPR